MYNYKCKKLMVDSESAAVYNFVMKNSFLYLFVFLIIIPSLSFAENLNINGFELPMILHEDWLQDKESVKYARFPVSFNLKFFLSDKGCVDSLRYEPQDTLKYMDGVIASLNNIDFSPGRYLDKDIPTILPARLEFLFEKYKPRASLILPGSSGRYIIDRDLINKFLEFNNLNQASVEKIPPYFCHFGDDMNPDIYRFAVFKVDLDSTGIIKNIETVLTNHNHYSDMFFNVLLYADYRPAKFDGKPVSSSIYVTVRFFQRLAYPTEIWPISHQKELDYSYDYHRISVRPYLDSIINPPFPVNMSDGAIVMEEKIVFVDTVQVGVTIDTLGNIVKSQYTEPTSIVSEKTSNLALKKLKYIPAIDINGNKVKFEGRLTIIYGNNSNNIRIVSNWLK